ncbi:hypothetical protein AFNJKBDN_CDS0007 [Halorubrum virus V_ICIS4]|nr:hypothetical protein AFNJKBDN_CDS0007 [Halorubrum virus V_ICIS4]
MSVEFGPRDETAGLLGRVFGLSVQALLVVFRLIDRSEPRVRYDRERAILTFSGESEYAGDEFRRGQAAMAVAAGGAMSPVAALLGSTMAMDSVATVFGATAAAPLAVVSLALMVLTLLTLSGLWSVGDSISVVDHTTEPAPDALDKLKQRYTNGEIDEQELADEAAEAWER